MRREILMPLPTKSFKKFKVLVAAPQNKIKMYAWPDYIGRATNLTAINYTYDLFFVDNSKTKDNAKEIMRQGIPCQWLNPKNKQNQQYIADSMEVIRHKAIQGNYDILVVLETDIIPPRDFIERLLLHQKNVVSGAYFIGQGENSHLMLQQIEVGNGFRNTTNITGGKDILFANNKLHQVYAAGLGCILIHREVFSKFAFRYEKGANAHPDSFFAVDLHRAGVPQYLDASFICEHKNQSWANVTDWVV